MRTWWRHRTAKIISAVAAVLVVVGGIFGSMLIARANAAPSLPPLIFGITDSITAVNGTTHAIAWQQRPFGGHVWYGAPFLGDGNVYASFNDGSIYAFGERTKRVTWRTVEGESFVFGFDPTLHLVFANTNGSYFALNSKTGAQVWKNYGFFSGNQVLYEAYGIVFVQDNELGKLTAVNAGTGKTLWSIPLKITTFPIAFSNWAAFVPCFDGIYAISLSNGKILWHNPAVHGDVAYGQGMVVVTDEKAYVALAPATGAQQWRYAIISLMPSLTPVTIANHTIFAEPGNGHIYAFKLSNGALLWNIYVGNNYPAALLWYQGTLFSGVTGGPAAYNATNGQFLWSGPVGLGSQLAILPAGQQSI